MKVLCLLLLFSLALPVAARPGPLIVVLLPGTSLRDWQNADAPNLHHLMATGAIAVMNTRTARLPNDQARETPESAALTLGAGARAAGGPEAAAFFAPVVTVPDVGATAGALYQRRCGHPAPPQAAVNLGWPQLLRENAGRGYDIHPGNLADTLTAAGIPIRAGGGRFSNLLAVSGDGTVRTAATFAVQPLECLIWDAGSDLPSADVLIGQAEAKVSAQQGRLVVLSPFVSDKDYGQGRRLTPVLEWGMDVPAGLILSASTRRPGLVTSTDFAPTVAAYFGLTTMAVRPFGQAWSTRPTPDAVTQTHRLEEQAYRQANGMKTLPYLAVGLAFWIVSGTLLALRDRMPLAWPLVPPALVLSLLVSATATMIWLMLCFFLLFSIAPRRRMREGGPLLVLLTLMAVLVPLDALGGSHLMHGGLLGYSAVEGARFYGIGNEAMGGLIGSLLVLTARFWRPVRAVQATIVLLLLCLALLFGTQGAKAGGVLVSLAAFGTLCYELRGGRWSPRIAFFLLFAAALAVALVALGDAFLPGSRHSHIGEAVERIHSGGWGEARDIVGRKLAVESRLAYHSAWACLLWAGLQCVTALWKRSGNREGQRPLQTAGLVAVGACLLLNDAGVVAAALCLVPLWSEAARRFVKEKPPEKFSPGAAKTEPSG